MALVTDNAPGSGRSSGGDSAWSNINRLIAQTGEAVCDNSAKNRSPQTLFVTEFFSGITYDLSTQPTVTGIRLRLNRRRANNTTQASDSIIRLAVNGGQVGQNKASSVAWPTSSQFATYGGQGDLWGLTASQANSFFQNTGPRRSYQFNSTVTVLIRPSDARTTTYISAAELTVYLSVKAVNVWNGSSWVKGDVNFAATTDTFTGGNVLRVWNGAEWVACYYR